MKKLMSGASMSVMVVYLMFAYAAWADVAAGEQRPMVNQVRVDYKPLFNGKDLTGWKIPEGDKTPGEA